MEPLIDAEEMKVLTEARQRAQRLLDEMLKQQADLLQNPPKHLEPDKVELGKTAMQKAIDAARRTVQNVDDALKLASTSSN